MAVLISQPVYEDLERLIAFRDSVLEKCILRSHDNKTSYCDIPAEWKDGDSHDDAVQHLHEFLNVEPSSIQAAPGNILGVLAKDNSLLKVMLGKVVQLRDELTSGTIIPEVYDSEFNTVVGEVRTLLEERGYRATNTNDESKLHAMN